MTLKEAIEVLEHHNRWRRGDDDLEMIDPKKVGVAIDTALHLLKELLKNNE